MGKRFKKINAIDYVNIKSIHNFTEEIVKECYKIMASPHYGKKHDLSTVIESAMNIVAIDHFSEEESERFFEDELKANEYNKEILKKLPEDTYIEC